VIMEKVFSCFSSTFFQIMGTFSTYHSADVSRGYRTYEKWPVQPPLGIQFGSHDPFYALHASQPSLWAWSP